MRPLSAEDEAALRTIAERHGYFAARGPHTGEGSASRLIDALLAGEVVTLALSPADRHRLVAWLNEPPPPQDAWLPSCGASPRTCAPPSPKRRCAPRLKRRPQGMRRGVTRRYIPGWTCHTLALAIHAYAY